MLRLGSGRHGYQSQLLERRDAYRGGGGPCRLLLVDGHRGKVCRQHGINGNIRMISSRIRAELRQRHSTICHIEENWQIDDL